MPAAISVERLGKRYRLGGGAVGGRSLYELFSGGLERIAGRGSGAAPARKDEFWALDDVSFTIQPGEVVGVVGRNGAGKSTLLKILSRITAPTRGRVVLRGNLASLLEVGTGFHPELTGRENIFLNGIILGMRRREIARKLDEIVAFAEVGEFLDTPVKRYSSGMYVRLAFAVAAHLDADVLLIDEVLAVGDVAFQRKSLGKMRSVASGGRTVLFVSHNLGAVRSLCHDVLLLERGRLAYHGPTGPGLERYEASAAEVGATLDGSAFTGPLVRVVEFSRFELEQEGQSVVLVDPAQPLTVRAIGTSRRTFGTLDVTLSVFRDGLRVFSCHDAPPGEAMRQGAFTSEFRIPAHLLRPGRFTIGLGGGRPSSGEWIWGPDVGSFEVSPRWDAVTQSRDEGAITVRYEGARRQ